MTAADTSFFAGSASVRFSAPASISDLVWERRYRHDDEPSLGQTWTRVAAAVAAAEPAPDAARWCERFREMLASLRFLPGGRIVAAAGTGRRVTLGSASGSLNLPRFVRRAFLPDASLDHAALEWTAAVATRFLDDVLDVTAFPFAAQAHAALALRPIGLGITGLADALLMLGLRYDSPAARNVASEIARSLAQAACRASIALAVERGPFPALRLREHLAGEHVQRLPVEIQAELAAHGVRNSQLLALAPARSISLLAGNVSSGVEPIFRAAWRCHLDPAGCDDEIDVVDYAVARWRGRPVAMAALPPAFVDAATLTPEAGLEMGAALQPHVDGPILSTPARSIRLAN